VQIKEQAVKFSKWLSREMTKIGRTDPGETRAGRFPFIFPFDYGLYAQQIIFD